MKKMPEKMIAVMLLICMFFLSAPLASIADTKDKEQHLGARLSYIVDAEGTLSINNEVATVDCWVAGHVNDATKAKIIVELQLESGTDNWIAYATWVDTRNDYEAYVYETKSVKTGQNYRVKVTATVWEGSQSETVTFFTDEMTA